MKPNGKKYAWALTQKRRIKPLKKIKVTQNPKTKPTSLCEKFSYRGDFK